MNEAILAYIVAFCSGLLGGLAGSLLWAFGLRRGCRRLALRLNDVEDRLLSMKGKQAANARWDLQKFEEQALKTEQRPVKTGRYDNDPPEF